MALEEGESWEVTIGFDYEEAVHSHLWCLKKKAPFLGTTAQQAQGLGVPRTYQDPGERPPCALKHSDLGVGGSPGT